MLPSFRLIAATFFCGFLAVFAGLRMASSLNGFHGALPVMAAHAAPATVSSVTDREARRSVSSVPMMYDLRFAVSTVPPNLVRAAPSVFDRPSPPLSIVPPDDIAAEAAASIEPETTQPEITVAAIQPDAVVAAPPTISLLMPAAIEPQPDSAAETSDTPAAALEPASAESPVPEPSTGAIEAPVQQTVIDQAAKAAVPMPTAKPQAAKPAPVATVKAKPVRKKMRVRTAQRAAPANIGGFGSSTSSPFGNP